MFDVFVCAVDVLYVWCVFFVFCCFIYIFFDAFICLMFFCCFDMFDVFYMLDVFSICVMFILYVWCSVLFLFDMCDVIIWLFCFLFLWYVWFVFIRLMLLYVWCVFVFCLIFLFVFYTFDVFCLCFVVLIFFSKSSGAIFTTPVTPLFLPRLQQKRLHQQQSCSVDMFDVAVLCQGGWQGWGMCRISTIDPPCGQLQHVISNVLWPYLDTQKELEALD